MKILVVGQHYYPEQFRVTDICEELVKRGYDVTMLTGLPNYPEGKVYKGYRLFGKRNEIINGVKVVRSWLIPRGKNKLMLFLNYLSFCTFASLKVLFMKKEYDVVISYQTSPVFMSVPAILYKKLTGKKLFLYCLDIWPECFAAVTNFSRDSIFYKWLTKISAWVYNNADILAVSTKAFVSYLKDKLKVEKEYVYIPQYAEEVFCCDDIEISSKNDNDKSDINILFAGNLGYMQSIDTIIKAANELKGNESIKWHLVGEGSNKRRCERLARSYDLVDKTVFFHGKKSLEEMPQVYSNADIFLITLKANSFVSLTLPGKLQSYMAYGKPVLGSADGEVCRIIGESEAGLCCKAEDYIALAENALYLQENMDKWSVYAQNAKSYYKKNFSKSKLIDNICSIIERLI